MGAHQVVGYKAILIDHSTLLTHSLGTKKVASFPDHQCISQQVAKSLTMQLLHPSG